MIDILENYFWRSIPEDNTFQTNRNLTQKVDGAGRIQPYKGNTTVFLLDKDTKKNLKQLQDLLYQAVPEMLAERLQEDTFHMTLHSLEDDKPDTPGLAERMAEAARKADALLKDWKNSPPLRMLTSWLFNMVDTSIVLGLMPADPDSWHRLDEMYMALEAVKPLGYDMTPHITMAYYRPGIYDRTQMDRLRNVLQNVDMEITLPMKALVRQNFADMNHYETVPCE